ncbi:hypothetical protein X741_26740 [Mesorhizobium sp. LNHC229A00]|nr:hypothetical protein X741_26740 [Mesorhizobium sp. LNHC229A00]
MPWRKDIVFDTVGRLTLGLNRHQNRRPRPDRPPAITMAANTELLVSILPKQLLVVHEGLPA